MGRNFLDYFTSYEVSARIMGGELHGSGADRYVSAPAYGHSRDDRSMTFQAGKYPDGLLVKLFGEGDPLKNKDYIFEMHGAPPFTPNKRKRAAKPVELNSSVPDSDAQDSGPQYSGPSEPPEIQLSSLGEILKKGNGAAKEDKPRLVEKYDFNEIDGTMRYQNLRFEPKTFRQRHPNPDGGWIWNLKGVEPLPYHLDEFAKYPDAQIVICEGEKDCDRVQEGGLPRHYRRQGILADYLEVF